MWAVGKKVKGIKEHICLFKCHFPITSRNFAKFSVSSEPFLFGLIIIFLHHKYFKASPLFVFFTLHTGFVFLRKLAAEMLF